jgi:cytoskeletal protein CcmA (bactofilin family)
MGMLDDMTEEFNQLGFEYVVKAQTIEVWEDINEKTLFMGQVVKIYGNCSTDLAIMAQMAEIHGNVGGKVYFRGQLLVIQPNAVITNGVDVMAQAVKNYGKVEGGITGKYQIKK